MRGITPNQIAKVKAILALLHPAFSEMEPGGDGSSTRALPKQQQNLVANFRRNFLAHKNVPRKGLSFWEQFTLYLIQKNSLRISNSIFHANSASNGNQTGLACALYARVTEGGVILIENSSFTENTADFYGGAVVINKSSDPTGISVI